MSGRIGPAALLGALLLGLPFAAPATASGEARSQPRRYLGSFSEADVRAAVGEGATARENRWRIAEWKARPNTLVAISFRAIKGGGDLARLGAHAAVLEARDGKLAAVAETALAFPDADCANGDDAPLGEDSAPRLDLDLGPYVIAPGNIAIGVRLHCHNTFGSGEGDSSRLKLLELRAATLRDVFDQRIEWENHDRVHGDTGGRGVVVVGKTQHDGYFDLAIRMRKIVERATAGGQSITQHLVETKRFIWTKERYAAPAPQ